MASSTLTGAIETITVSMALARRRLGWTLTSNKEGETNMRFLKLQTEGLKVEHLIYYNKDAIAVWDIEVSCGLCWMDTVRDEFRYMWN